jgi:FlaA1/EpsC-like NDP-sugar epimerase
MKNPVILGSVTYGKIFLPYLTEQGFNILGFVDDNEKSWGKNIHGLASWG